MAHRFCFALSVTLLFACSCAAAQNDASYRGRSAMISPDDTIEEIVEKAARVRPAPRQVAWQELEFTAFIHFGMNTFTDREWGTGKESPDQFAPTAFDARQWIRAFKAAGMKGVVLTAKHHDGFCLWQTDTTGHSIKNSAWRNGKGDVVREVADACRAGGLQFGVYLSPWDRNTTEFGKPGYNAIFQKQLRELLTNYGEVYDVWFDGAHAPGDKPEIFDWSGHFKLIRKLQPNACISVMGPDVRWCGNEAGHTRATEWNVVPIKSGDPRPAELSQETTVAIVKNFNSRAQDLGSRAAIKDAQQLIWRPAMTNTSIRPGWFYHASQDKKVRSLQNLLDIYYGSVGGNTQFLLNIPPDRRGLVHENDVRRLTQLGRVLRGIFDENLALNAEVTSDASIKQNAAATTVDGNNNTYWTTQEGVTTAQITYDLGAPKTFNVAMLQEYIRIGQRIEQFSLEVLQGAEWKTIAQATTVGYKKLLRFEPVTARKVRLRITQSRLCPTLSAFGLFRSPVLLSAPSISRNRKGMVTLEAAPGIAIHYTLDGSKPARQSKRYTKPFPLPEGGLVRAVSIPNENVVDTGLPTESAHEFGIAKSGWKVVSADSEEPHADNHAAKAIDDDPSTFWHTQWQGGNPGYPHEIVIDLGKTVEATGFTYLPRQDGKDGGLVARYEFYVSNEKNQWGEPVIRGEFDNILNNPVQQRVLFSKKKTGRYLRFVALASPNNKQWAGAAEIGVLVKGR